MNIPAISTSMSQAKLKQEVGVSVSKMILDSVKGQSADLLKMMEVNTEIMARSIDPNIGGNIDIYA